QFRLGGVDLALQPRGHRLGQGGQPPLGRVLARLKTFILPGGAPVAATLHVARTVCRRAERLLVALSRGRTLDARFMEYLNRLSDWLFAHARLANHRAGVADVPWTHT
ncbi:MAG: ATP:cob(I)alamin adenosyltransferase, partial [Sphingomonas sp.]